MAGSARGVGGVVVTSGEVAAWVAATRAAQGLPAGVEDPAAVRAVVALLGGQAPADGLTRSGSLREGPTASDSPDRLDSAGVEAPAARSSREDDGVV